MPPISSQARNELVRQYEEPLHRDSGVTICNLYSGFPIGVDSRALSTTNFGSDVSDHTPDVYSTVGAGKQ
jgi:hypothetical protein